MKRQRVAVIDLPTRVEVWAYTDDGKAHRLSQGDHAIHPDLADALIKSRTRGSLEAMTEAQVRLAGVSP